MKYIFVFFFFVFVMFVNGQNHVKWAFSFDSISSNIVVQGTIDHGWHLYSSSTPENAGPVPVNIVLKKDKKYKQIGKSKEISPYKFIYDTNFGSNVAIIENEYIASIPIKVKGNCTVRGEVYYMICDDSMCLPPITVGFNLIIK